MWCACEQGTQAAGDKSSTHIPGTGSTRGIATTGVKEDRDQPQGQRRCEGKGHTRQSSAFAEKEEDGRQSEARNVLPWHAKLRAGDLSLEF